MAEQNNVNTDVLQQIIDSNPLVKSGMKKIQKNQDEQIDQAMQGGMSSQEVMTKLFELANIKQPVAGTMKGPLAIADLFSGKGFHPLAKQEEPIGLDAAAKIMELQQTAEKQPYEMEKMKADLLNALLDIQEKTNPEIGAQRKEIEAKATARGTKAGEKEISLSEFNKQLDVYLQLADAVPSTEGLGRYTNQASLAIDSLMGQKSPASKAYAEMRSLNNYLTPNLRRLSGDVGNATVWEQQAAGKLLIDGSESTGLKKLKIATLKDLTKAINNKEPSDVRRVLKELMDNKIFTDAYGKFTPPKLSKSEALKKGATGYDSEKGIWVDKNGNEVK